MMHQDLGCAVAGRGRIWLAHRMWPVWLAATGCLRSCESLRDSDRPPLLQGLASLSSGGQTPFPLTKGYRLYIPCSEFTICILDLVWAMQTCKRCNHRGAAKGATSSRFHVRELTDHLISMQSSGLPGMVRMRWYQRTVDIFAYLADHPDASWFLIESYPLLPDSHDKAYQNFGLQ